MDKEAKDLLTYALERLSVCREWDQTINRKAVRLLFASLTMSEMSWPWAGQKKWKRGFKALWYRQIDDLLCLAAVMAFRKKGLPWKKHNRLTREDNYPIYEAVRAVLHLSVSTVKKTYQRALKTYKDDMPPIFRERRRRGSAT